MTPHNWVRSEPWEFKTPGVPVFKMVTYTCERCGTKVDVPLHMINSNGNQLPRFVRKRSKIHADCFKDSVRQVMKS